MSNVYEESLKLHEANHGKLSVVSKVTVKSREDLSLAYSPGVAEPCRKILPARCSKSAGLQGQSKSCMAINLFCTLVPAPIF